MERLLKNENQARKYRKEFAGVLRKTVTAKMKLADTYYRKGDYQHALQRYQMCLEPCEELEFYEIYSESAEEKLAQCYASIVWCMLLTNNQDYEDIKQFALKGLKYDNDNWELNLKLAHVYLLHNEFNNARKIYLKARDKFAIYPRRAYRTEILADFKKLQSRRITHPDMKKVEQLLNKR